jgi:RNA polymerase sigma-54 factor
MSLKMGLVLSQKMKQELRMTPQLQQAIRLLQLSNLELVEEIQKELTENPLLEEVDDANDDFQNRDLMEEAFAEKITDADEQTMQIDQNLSTELQFKNQDQDQISIHEDRLSQSLLDQDEQDFRHELGQKEISHSEQLSISEWEDYLHKEDESAKFDIDFKSTQEDDEYSQDIKSKSNHETLYEHLSWQLSMSDLSESEREVGDYIIGNLDTKGYFTEMTTQDVADHFDLQVEFVDDVLEVLQSFDPIGVCSRDITECLMIQAKFYNMGEQVEDILQNHLDLLEHKKYNVLARKLKVSQERIFELAQMIQSLDPYPSRQYTSDEQSYISPDLSVEKLKNGQYQVSLNQDFIPKLKINQYYRNAILGNADDTTKQYVAERLNSAQWLLRSIEQRRNTMIRVMQSIIEHQKEFFDKGTDYLKPLVLKTIADDVELHESTISRVTSNKYVETPRGLFELKYFFKSSIQSASGEDLSSEAVKNKIKRLIAQEPDLKPLSDQQIVEFLKKDGLKIARRTVAKYREAMQILPSSQRKKSF